VVAAGVGAATSARRQCRVPSRCGGARTRVRWRAQDSACARKVTTRLGVGRTRGGAAEDTAEPGSTPWVAASAASAIGSRGCVRVHGGQAGRAHGGLG
jgi:hypothetical protein